MKRRVRVASIALEDVQRAAEDIYIYGYPLLLMDLTRRMNTATIQPSSHDAPVNRFAHSRFLPGPFDRRGPHPNSDCLTSSAWVDLNKEPVVLSVPHTQRYYLLSLFSEWYEILGSISPQKTETHPGHFGLVGPKWSGKLPPGVKRIESPTEFVWIQGYCAVDGAEDIQLAHSLQNQILLTPLSEWGLPPSPHALPCRLKFDEKTTPQEQLSALDAQRFFTHLSTLMQRNQAQPSSCDSEILAECARIGYFPSEDFAFEMLPGDTVEAMHSAVAAAQSRIVEAETKSGQRVSGNWSLYTHPGMYQRDYLARAAAARTGHTVTLAEDITCFQTAVDDAGEPLKGTHRYTMDLDANRMPPVNGFWSLTLYDRSHHLVTNDIQRYALGDRDRLRHNPDNSLSIHIQHEWPGANQDSNWLPAPKDSFNLILRLYWPKAEILNGTWRPPAVTRVN
jgi:hypothetical protein